VFRRHQRVGIPWLYLTKMALLADFVGSGKTVHAGGLFALMQETGEFEHRRGVVVVGRPAAILQWQSELNRMVPRLDVAAAVGSRQRRIETYLHPWDVMLIGPQMLINDYDTLTRFPISTLVLDDLDPLRNRETKTAYTIRQLNREVMLDRLVVMSATPLQKKLHELYHILEIVGGDSVLGTPKQFDLRYVRREKVTVYNEESGRTSQQEQFQGYKRLPEFKRRIAPFTLRRTPDDLDDVSIPRINPVDHWLTLHEGQAERYAELQSGIVSYIRSDEFGRASEIKRQAGAMKRLHAAAAICDGLGTLGLPDGPGASVKLDWLIDELTGDLADEKAVTFALYKPTIQVIQARLEVEGIGYETIWGQDRNPEHRKAAIERFWDDPSCRIMLGTTAIEQSVNLQCARHLVNVGQIMNPARMLQLAGRIARDGSAYQHVWVHNLRCVGTHEERWLRKLEREQALANYIWDESNDLFKAISPLELLQMIGDVG